MVHPVGSRQRLHLGAGGGRAPRSVFDTADRNVFGSVDDSRLCGQRLSAAAISNAHSYATGDDFVGDDILSGVYLLRATFVGAVIRRTDGD